MFRSHLFLLSTAAICQVVAHASTPASQKKSQKQETRPNVVMIAVDDWNMLLGGVFGSDLARTPNLDRLMRSGISFVNCHTAASFSTPSRTALMTGMAPWKSGCYTNQPHLFNIPERITIDELFKQNGYETLGAGKVYHHMPGYVNLDGFDQYFVWNPALMEKGWPYDAWGKGCKALPGPMPFGELGKSVYENFDTYPLPNSMEQDMADTKTVNWAVDVINRKHDRPFFLAVGLYAPHKPNYCPQKYFEMHPLEGINLDQFQLDSAYFRSNDLPKDIVDFYRGRIKKHHLNGVLTVSDGWKKSIQGYLACCSYADAQIGRILDALQYSGIANNTIVIFWSDNGYHLGEKQLWAKHTPYKQTSNVPMIWSGPGMEKNTEYKGVVSLLDIFPTLIDLCHLNPTSDIMDGISIADILYGGKGNRNRYVVMANQEKGYSIISEKWHYNFYNETKAEELFDRDNDLYEQHNLSTNPKYSQILRSMQSKLPKDPVSPGALPRVGCKLICKGKSFKWIPVIKKK